MKNSIQLTLLTVYLTFSLAAAVSAVPINGLFIPDMTHCDGPNLPQDQLTHELGDGPAATPFPIDERVLVSVTPLPAPFPSCEPDDGIANDWLIRMTNVGPKSWQDLYFVADDIGFVVGNYDGVMQDLSNPGVAPSQAFRIDGTVTPGVNNPLLLETGVADEVFASGETWDFFVVNFTGGIPSFGSVASFGFGSLPNQFSTASILANPVPEPCGILSAITAALLCLVSGKRRK